MKKLNLPVIKEPLPPPRTLSMAEYIQFLEIYRRYFFDRKVYEYWKEKRTVKERFVLK